MSSAVTKPRKDLRSEYHLACPQCGQSEKLSIEITCTDRAAATCTLEVDDEVQ